MPALLSVFCRETTEEGEGAVLTPILGIHMILTESEAMDKGLVVHELHDYTLMGQAFNSCLNILRTEAN